jgi:hypothetical protein
MIGFKKLALVVSISAALPAFAAQGIVGGYIGINSAPNGLTEYQALNPGAIQLTSFNGANLGSFTIGSAAYIADGASIVSTSGFGEFIDSSSLRWSVDNGAFQTIALEQSGTRNFSDPASNTYDLPGSTAYWGLLGPSTNFLAGLGVGSHTLAINFAAASNLQTYSLNNGGSNYVATFNVAAAVPEPESYALLLSGLGLMAAIGRRREPRDEA